MGQAATAATVRAMSRTAFLAAGAFAIFAAAALANGGEPLQTRQAMIDGVNPAALAIWEVTNAAMDDDGGLDPALLDAEAWSRLEEAARMLEDYGRRMAEAEVIVAGGPDLVPDGFRAVSADMAAQAAALGEAARARDTATTGDLAFGIDGACQACHTRYWFLQQG